MLVFFIVVLLSSCSGGGGSGGTAGGESIYDPGASIAAVTFADAYGITLQVRDDSGEFVPVHDGMYVEPGTKRFSVDIEGDPAGIGKVLVSDGGLYQREAVRQGGSYVCDFEIGDERLYASVLVQVVHPDKKASKEKFVFRTARDDHEGSFILNGLGILASQGFIDAEQAQIAEELDAFVGKAFDCIRTDGTGLISALSYGDGDPGTVDIDLKTLDTVQDGAFPSAVIHAVFTIRNVSLAAADVYGQDLISTQNNDLDIDAYIALGDVDAEGNRGLVIDLLGSAQARFKNDFFLRPVLEDILETELQVIERAPLSADLKNLGSTIREALPGSITVNDAEVNLDTLFDKLDMNLDKYLFMDLYGIPEDTASGVLALGAGLYVADYDEVFYPDAEPATPPDGSQADEVFNNLTESMIDNAFETIRQKYDGLVTNLSYGDNNPQTQDFTVNSLVITNTGDVNAKLMHASITIHDVDFRAVSFLGLALICTDDNDLTIDATFLLRYQQSGGSGSFVLDMQNVSDARFSDYFLGRAVVEEMVKSDVAGMENITLNIDDVLGDLDAGIDLSGCGTEGPLFPDVFAKLSPYEWDLGLPEGYNVSCAVSQDNINWVLAQTLGQDLEWDVYEMLSALLGEDFAGFTPDRTEGEETIMRLSVPPVLDVRGPRIRMELDDVLIQYRLDGAPQWEASVDLDLILDVRAVDGELEIFLNPVPENCHFHVMRDNKGNLGVFDHSDLVTNIVDRLPQMLGNSPGGPVFTVGLDRFEPTLVLEAVDEPIAVSAGGGYLYLDAAVLDLDLAWLMDLFNSI